MPDKICDKRRNQILSALKDLEKNSPIMTYRNGAPIWKRYKLDPMLMRILTRIGIMKYIGCWKYQWNAGKPDAAMANRAALAYRRYMRQAIEKSKENEKEMSAYDYYRTM